MHNLFDQRRVNLASVELCGYALTWWNLIQENQLVLGHEHINTWEEMKQVMRRQYVPSSYQRDLRNGLQRLKQGKRSVDEYYKEMELLLVRTGIREDLELKMAIFWVVSMRKLLVLLRYFHTILCKTLLIKLCVLKENSARDTWKILCKSFYCSPMTQAAVQQFFRWGTVPRCSS